VIAASEDIVARCLNFHGSEQQAEAAQKEAGGGYFASGFSKACRQELDELRTKI
jgi:hypothetical protein